MTTTLRAMAAPRARRGAEAEALAGACEQESVKFISVGLYCFFSAEEEIEAKAREKKEVETIKSGK